MYLLTSILLCTFLCSHTQVLLIKWLRASWLYETWVLVEKVGTSLNAFINVQLRIYFIALYVNHVELHSDFLYIIPHYYFFPIKDQKREEEKQQWLTRLDAATWHRNVIGLVSFHCANVMFVFLHFCCIFFLLNLTLTLLILSSDSSLTSGWNTNYQSAAATAACDKSLSNTLMPSNCLWRPLPVCCLSGTLAPPHPTPFKPPLVHHFSFALFSPLLLGGVFIPDAIFQPGCPYVDSSPLKCVIFIMSQVCQCASLMFTPPPCVLCIFVVVVTSVLLGF